MFKIKKHFVTLLSLSLILSSCGSADNGETFIINEKTVENAVALNSKVLSNEGDLLVEIQGEGVTFNKDISNSQVLVRDFSKELPETTSTDENDYVTYDQLKSVCADEYYVYTSTNSKSLYVTIPSVSNENAYALLVAPEASSLGKIGYALFSNIYSEENASELQVKALNTGKANGYFNEWSFVYSYQNGTLADSFTMNDVILSGAFENCHVYSLISDDAHIEVRIRGLIKEDSSIGYVGFNATSFKDNDSSFVFPYQIEYPTAVMLNYTYNVDLSVKEASFEMAFYDAEVPSKISPSDIKIEGIVCKEAIPNIEDNTVKLILDTGEYESAADFTSALVSASISFYFLDLVTIDLSYIEPQIEANAYTKDNKTYLEFFPAEKGILEIDTEKLLTDSLYIPSIAEEPFFDLSKATISRNQTGNGYILAWDGLSEENQGQIMILDGTLTVGEYEIPLIGTYSYFSLISYYTDEHDNALLKNFIFVNKAAEVDDGNIGQFDSEITQAAHSAGTVLGIISAVLGGVLGILGGVFGVEGAGKMVTVGILGAISFGLSMSSMIVGMNEMEEGLKSLAEAVQFVSGNVVEIRRDLMALNYKVDTLIVKERMNHDQDMFERYRDRLTEFQNRFEKPIYDLQSEFGDMTNAYLASLFKGGAIGEYDFGDTLDIHYSKSSKANAAGVSYFDEKHNRLLDEDVEEGSVKTFNVKFNNQAELFDSTYSTYRKTMQINDPVKVKAIMAIKEGLANGSVVLSGDDAPIIDDTNIEQVAGDIYQACFMRCEYLALSREDKAKDYIAYLTAADDYFMRFSGTGNYVGEAAASFIYKMLTLQYNFQSEVEEKIHNTHAQYAAKILQIYNNTLMIKKYNDNVFNMNRIYTSYKAATDYLYENTWIHEYKGDKSKLPQGKDTPLDYCYVTDSFIRIGTIETRYKVSMDKKNFKVDGTYAYEVNLADPNFKADQKAPNMLSLTQLSSFLVDANNVRVIMERKKMISNASNNEYILKNKNLFDWDQYVKNCQRKTSEGERAIVQETIRNGKPIDINMPRFIYSYNGASAINAGDPLTTDFKCYPSQKAWSGSNYFKIHELTDAFGKGVRGKAEKQYWDGWVIKGEVGTLDDVSYGALSSNINRLVHYHEAHWYWINDEHWLFEEYYRGYQTKDWNDLHVASMTYDLAMIMVF